MPSEPNWFEEIILFLYIDIEMLHLVLKKKKSKRCQNDWETIFDILLFIVFSKTVVILQSINNQILEIVVCVSNNTLCCAAF